MFRAVVQKAARSGAQSCADPITQFLGCRVGKGDHQDFIWRQRPGKSLFITVLKNQPDIEQGDGICLASSRAGFDEAAATQRQTEWLQCDAHSTAS